MSLDGLIEAPGGAEDDRHAGWTFEIDRGEEGNAFGDVSEKKPLRLVGSRELGDGIALLTYEPTG